MPLIFAPANEPGSRKRYRVGINFKFKIMGKIVNQGRSNSDEKDWLSARQSMLKVTKTTTTPHGQTLDWIPIESQGTEKIATPPPTDASVNQQNEKGPMNHLLFEIGEQGPEGHVPVLRPDLSKLPESISIKDLFNKRGGLQVNSRRKNKKPTDPNPFGYFHASSSETTNVYGCEGWLNVWDPQISIHSSPGDDHSISQTWLQNYQAAQTHSIEAGWTVDLALNGDLKPHLFTYFTTNGYGPGGDNLGGYNRLQAGWKQYHASIFPGVLLSPVSVINGAQVEL
jgi:Neprosin